jgi:hypothetical protein
MNITNLITLSEEARKKVSQPTPLSPSPPLHEQQKWTLAQFDYAVQALASMHIKGITSGKQWDEANSLHRCAEFSLRVWGIIYPSS